MQHIGGSQQNVLNENRPQRSFSEIGFRSERERVKPFEVQKMGGDDDEDVVDGEEAGIDDIAFEKCNLNVDLP